jgi:hypothetical protein
MRVLEVLVKLPDIHINPIHRDLAIIMTMGLLIAMAVVTIGFVIFH